MVALTSAAGLLALLQEDDVELKHYALQQLNLVVDSFWAEISDQVEKLEILSEDEAFPFRKLASLVTAKVYYNLGELDQSLTFALGAAEELDINSTSQFVTIVIEQAIDLYTRNQQQGVASDARLAAIVDRMFTRCQDSNAYHEVLGLALETQRLDILEKVIRGAKEPHKLLKYTIDIVMTLVASPPFRAAVLDVVVRLLQQLGDPDASSLCQCAVLLNRVDIVLDVILQLLQADKYALALQLAFDICDGAPQAFVLELQGQLAGSEAAQGDHADALQRLSAVLGGEVSLAMNLEFLSRNNHADIGLLTATKDANPRNPVCHSATVLSNAIMHAGTTSDAFLRAQRDWLSKATHWAKFSAVAGLGVIHQGHVAQARTVLAPYLPKDSGAGSPYEKGGSLYALGLIFANHGKAEVAYLQGQLRTGAAAGDSHNGQVVQHGAALGLGLAAMGTQNNDVYEQLKNVLYTDSAVAGEAAGIAMGLTLLGSGSDAALTDMLQYARDTQHEKIIRGLGLGMALVCLGTQSGADALIEKLLSDHDALLRVAGCHVLAMAYASTSQNGVIRKLLHLAVSDVSDEVRRAAVAALGFILSRTPEQVPGVVSLLCESFNPHVRYGACLALGIACAGTGLKDAVALIEPMTQDSSAIVRQGALVALALIMMQQQNQHPKVESTRRLFQKVIGDKHEDLLAKFGAIYAQGIMEAGGRNVTISLSRDHGHLDSQAAVGLLLFTQFWYWFPMGHCLALALRPSAIVGVTSDLRLPVVNIECAAPASLYAYPKPAEAVKEKSKEKIATAVLSITTRSKKLAGNKDKEKEKPKEDEPAPMAVDATPVPEAPTHTLANPCRVLPEQLAKLTLTGRFVPVRGGPLHTGVTVLTDQQPGADAQYITVALPGGIAEEEAAPPPDFEFNVALENE